MYRLELELEIVGSSPARVTISTIDGFTYLPNTDSTIYQPELGVVLIYKVLNCNNESDGTMVGRKYSWLAPLARLSSLCPYSGPAVLPKLERSSIL